MLLDWIGPNSQIAQHFKAIFDSEMRSNSRKSVLSLFPGCGNSFSCGPSDPRQGNWLRRCASAHNSLTSAAREWKSGLLVHLQRTWSHSPWNQVDMQNHGVLNSSSFLKPSQHFATSADLFTECIWGWGCLFVSRESVFNLLPNNSILLEKLWQPQPQVFGPLFQWLYFSPAWTKLPFRGIPLLTLGCAKAFSLKRKRLSLNYILQHCPVLSFLHIQVSRADDFLLSQMETLT